jgi:hypothetical protein
MKRKRSPAALRIALRRQSRQAAAAVGRLIALGAEYGHAASGPDGEPNRANSALLALERAKEELAKAVDCYEHPRGSES